MEKPMHSYAHIDETALSYIDRLGLAYCRLNGYEWDEIVGPKPEGFDEMPEFDNDFFKLHRRTVWPTKHDYTDPKIKGLTEIIGEANASRCWWKFGLSESEQAWLEWYTGERLNRNGYDGHGYLKKPEPFLEKSADQSGSDALKPGADRGALFPILFKRLLRFLFFFLLGALLAHLSGCIFKF